MSTAFLWVLIAPCMAAAAEGPNKAALGSAFQTDIRPLMEGYCFDCHGAADLVEGDVNLAVMTTWDEAVKHPQTWQKVAEMLGNDLMPPADAEQPTVDERARMQRWVGDYLAIEAQAHAGDPGRVILRRLSNAEYTHTLRDLTGVETFDPAREFPADGAAGEGFTNTGGALVMSPALLNKYLDSAKDVASRDARAGWVSVFAPHNGARLDRRLTRANPSALRRIHRCRRRHSSQLAGDNLGDQPRRSAAD